MLRYFTLKEILILEIIIKFFKESILKKEFSNTFQENKIKKYEIIILS